MNDDEPKPDADQASAEPDAGSGEPAPAWEAELDHYPTRPPDQDPRWALWLFWIWACFASASIVFMVVLLVLGWFFD